MYVLKVTFNATLPQIAPRRFVRATLPNHRKMISEEQLERLMRESVSDSRKEPDFLRALLDARLYALAPFSDDHPRLRLWMFRRPDGVHFIPYFTNEAQAWESAAGQLQVLPMRGRMLLEISRGATVIINPNHESCTLYPEEIDGLLAGSIAVVNEEIPQEEFKVLALRPENPPQWLLDALRTMYR